MGSFTSNNRHGTFSVFSCVFCHCAREPLLTLSDTGASISFTPSRFIIGNTISTQQRLHIMIFHFSDHKHDYWAFHLPIAVLFVSILKSFTSYCEIVALAESLKLYIFFIARKKMSVLFLFYLNTQSLFFLLFVATFVHVRAHTAYLWESLFLQCSHGWPTSGYTVLVSDLIVL